MSEVTFAFRATDLIKSARRLETQFRDGYKLASRDAHDQMAAIVQARQAFQLRQSVRQTGREQRGDRRLQKSILDARNRSARVGGFSVGIESWLDRSPAALYWRALEVGGEPYTTRAFFVSKSGRASFASGAGFRTTHLRDPEQTLARPVKFGRDLHMYQSQSSRIPLIRVSGTPEYAYMVEGAYWFVYTYTVNAKLLTYQRHFRRHGFWFPQQQFQA